MAALRRATSGSGSADLDLDVTFAAGEEMLTEISTKFSPEALEAELVECGFVVEATWTSEGDEFLLTLARPTAERPAGARAGHRVTDGSGSPSRSLTASSMARWKVG